MGCPPAVGGPYWVLVTKPISHEASGWHFLSPPHFPSNTHAWQDGARGLPRGPRCREEGPEKEVTLGNQGWPAGETERGKGLLGSGTPHGAARGGMQVCLGGHFGAMETAQRGPGPAPPQTALLTSLGARGPTEQKHRGLVTVTAVVSSSR